MRHVHHAEITPGREVPHHAPALGHPPDQAPERVLSRAHVERRGAIHEGELEEHLLFEELEDDGVTRERCGITRSIPGIIELGLSGPMVMLEGIMKGPI